MNTPCEDPLDKPEGSPRPIDAATIAPLLRQYAEPLPTLDSSTFGEMFDRYRDARVVMIGALYGHFVERGGLMPCEQPVVEQLNAMLAKQLAGLVRDLWARSRADRHEYRPGPGGGG